jgi:hypothetical protein
VISFFAAAYAERYRTVWKEFLHTAGGAHPPPAQPDRYVYLLNNSQRAVSSVQGSTATRYRFSRLCFKAAVIEPLRDDESFEVITPEGTFRFTKREFYAEFPKVVVSPSYAERGMYHFPKVPQRAMKYLVP